VPRLVGDVFEAFGPIVTATGEDLDGFIGEVELHAVAVELDLVKPAFAGGTFSIEEASAGSMKSGKGALTPTAAGSYAERHRDTTQQDRCKS
jgi:hypothetical protein